MRTLVCLALTVALATTGSAQLYNADMELQPGAEFSTLEGWAIGAGGGWTDHVEFSAPNNDTLGELFGFYSVDQPQIIGQVSTWTFEAGMTYNFSSWAVGGGADTVSIPYEIGYLEGGDSVLDNFVLLAQEINDAIGRNAEGGQWLPMDGVSYTAVAGGPEIGKEIVVRCAGVNQGGGGAGGAWVDNMSLTPEPASLVLLALGALLRRR